MLDIVSHYVIRCTHKEKQGQPTQARPLQTTRYKEVKVMFASIKTAATYTHAIASAIGILVFSNEQTRAREVAAAKARIARRVAESKAQMQQAKEAIEQELQVMKVAIKTEQPIAPQPVLCFRQLDGSILEIAPQQPIAPQLPDPWTMAIELPNTLETATPQQHCWQLALPPARNLEPAKPAKPSTRKTQPAIDYSKLSIRELKKLASDRKIKRYSSLTKAQLIAALTTV